MIVETRERMRAKVGIYTTQPAWARQGHQEQADGNRQGRAESPVRLTFLSHSTKDADLLSAVFRLLERMGEGLHDKKAESLPQYTSPPRRPTVLERADPSKAEVHHVHDLEQQGQSLDWPWEDWRRRGITVAPNVAVWRVVGHANRQTWAGARCTLGRLRSERAWQVKDRAAPCTWSEQERNTATVWRMVCAHEHPRRPQGHKDLMRFLSCGRRDRAEGRGASLTVSDPRLVVWGWNATRRVAYQESRRFVSARGTRRAIVHATRPPAPPGHRPVPGGAKAGCPV
jgi:hypothetical protein